MNRALFVAFVAGAAMGCVRLNSGFAGEASSEDAPTGSTSDSASVGSASVGTGDADTGDSGGESSTTGPAPDMGTSAPCVRDPEPCTDPLSDTECEASHVCRPWANPDGAIGGLGCIPRKPDGPALGEPCDRCIDTCRQGAVCDPDSPSPTCVRLCNQTGDCPSADEQCVAQTIGSSTVGLCRPLDGGECDPVDSRTCSGGAQCDPKTLTCRAPFGSNCTFTDECLSDLVCAPVCFNGMPCCTQTCDLQLGDCPMGVCELPMNGGPALCVLD